MSEPIAAIATGTQTAAIGIVRVSGDGCFAICDRVFRPLSVPASVSPSASLPEDSGKPEPPRFAALPARKMVLGEILDSAGRTIDNGLAVRFPAPNSYTGEDCAEFHCHGSPVVLREVLSALFAAGARQAGPGEFTKRAFLNGRMDLTQAEAVVDLIDAETAAAARNAAAQLDGGLRRMLEPLQDALLDICSRFYAVVDYPDEDIEDVKPEEITRSLDTADGTLSRLLDGCRRGKVLKRGVSTAIIGRPNAGKSSLLNALAGYDRAIVTDIPGTTRDTVEASCVCGGTLLRLTDTAGLRETGDVVERLGVERSRRTVRDADLTLVVVDGTSVPEAEDREAVRLARETGKPWILVVSKRDLTDGKTSGNSLTDGEASENRLTDREASENRLTDGEPWDSGSPWDGTAPWDSLGEGAFRVLRVSSVTGAGLDALEAAVADLFPAGEGDGTLLTDARQEDAACRAREAVRRARSALEAGMTADAVLTDAEEALDAVGELTGRTAKEEIVSRIFERFCVGK
ncbi:MAG: tRNA uridine-5-carboxymethylaminomethyl(34) synthesis GTPase MnmE [Oscillibacter sp.]|nr:tRNA uridine-5-carboxymethylaminomethyl(34) synthesis GTPase MnmE [Oscillibacter sp.]